MENKSKQINSVERKTEDCQFRNFFIDELRDIYWAEKALHKALPKLRKAASCEELAQAFEKHILETERQIETLQQVFQLMGENARGKKCEAMEGLLKEADGMIEDTEKETCIRDAGLILAAQKAEHYEIATYGTLVAFARQMGKEDVADLLQKILDEEKNTDKTLSALAETSVNLCAVEE